MIVFAIIPKNTSQRIGKHFEKMSETDSPKEEDEESPWQIVRRKTKKKLLNRRSDLDHKKRHTFPNDGPNELQNNLALESQKSETSPSSLDYASLYKNNRNVVPNLNSTPKAATTINRLMDHTAKQLYDPELDESLQFEDTKSLSATISNHFYQSNSIHDDLEANGDSSPLLQRNHLDTMPFSFLNLIFD